jgi:hypothetical protein
MRVIWGMRFYISRGRVTRVSTGLAGLAALGMWGWLWRLALILWPLAVFSSHYKPTVLGWVIEVPWLIVVAVVWLSVQAPADR